MPFANNGLPREAITPEDKVRVQTTTIVQDAVSLGLGYTTKWREDIIASGTSVYAEFTIPDGFALSLIKRAINTNSGNFKYKVFPEATYSVLSSKVDDADSFAVTSNNRQDITDSQLLERINIDSAPNQADQVVYIDVFGEEGQGNRASGGLDSADDFVMYVGGQKLLLQLTNGSNSDASAVVTLEFILFPQEQLPIIE